MQVTVSDSTGKVVYRGQTDAAGAFATAKLQKGNYVVQFTSKKSLRGSHFDLAAHAGKAKMAAESVPGEKFAGAGVAMKVDVGGGLALTGQVIDSAARPKPRPTAKPESVEDSG